jgi:hypothetical protein
MDKRVKGVRTFKVMECDPFVSKADRGIAERFLIDKNLYSMPLSGQQLDTIDYHGRDTQGVLKANEGNWLFRRDCHVR